VGAEADPAAFTPSPKQPGRVISEAEDREFRNSLDFVRPYSLDGD
jgi:hypothetical protein